MNVNMKYIKTAALLPLCNINLMWCQTPTKEDRTVTLSIIADTTFTARQMPVIFNQAYAVSGDGLITDTSLEDAVAEDILSQAVKEQVVTVPCIASAMEAYPIATACIADLCLAYTIYSGAVDAYQEYVIADHTIFRLYQFLAPASGYYDICYQIPGNFTKPANTVCITSYNAKGSYPQTLYNQDTVSNQTITNNVLLQ